MNLKINKIRKWIDMNPMTADQLGLYRILFSLFSLFSLIGVARLDYLAELPHFLYEPPLSIAYFFNELPSLFFLHVINILLIISLVGMLFGYKTKLSGISFSLLFIVYFSFFNSYSTIGHSHLIPFTALVFSFSGWGRSFSIDCMIHPIPLKCRTYNTYPFFSLIVLYAIFTSGVFKLLGGWLDLDNQAVRFYFINNFTFSGNTNFLKELLAFKLTSKVFWEFLDYYIVLIETLPLLLIFYPRILRIVMFNMASFHLLVYLTLDIPFSVYPIIYLPFIIDWKKSLIVKKIIDRLQSKQNCKRKFHFVFIFTIIAALILNYMIDVSGNIILLHQGILLMISFIIVLIFFIEVIRLRLKKH